MAKRLEKLNPQKLNKEQNEPSDNSFLKGFSAGKSVSRGKSVVVNKLVIDGTVNVLKRAINNATPDNFDKILSVMEKVVALNKGSNVNLDTLSGELEVLETSLPASSNLIAENTRLNRDVLRRSPYAPELPRGPERKTPFTPIDKTLQADVARIQPPMAPPMAPATAPPMAPPTAPPFRPQPQPPLVDPESQRIASAAPVREPILADKPPPTNLVESDFDHLTFSQALDVAKESGLGTFRWQGELYSTRSSTDRASTTAPARQRNMAQGGPVTQNNRERVAAPSRTDLLTNLKAPKIKATSPTTQLSEFEKAFEAASSAGLETFKWEGNVFTTDKKAAPAQSPQLELELQPQAVAQAAPRVRRGARRRPQLQPQLQTQPPLSFSGGGLIKRKNYADGGLNLTTDEELRVQYGDLIDSLEGAQNRLYADTKGLVTLGTGTLYTPETQEEVSNTLRGLLDEGGNALFSDKDITKLENAATKMRKDISECDGDAKCISDVSSSKRKMVDDVDFKLSDQQRDALRDHEIDKRIKWLREDIPKFDNLPAALKVQLLQSKYREGKDAFPKTIKLLNQGKWAEAKKEMLRHDELDDPTISDGIKNRIEATAEALGDMVGLKDFAPGSEWHLENMEALPEAAIPRMKPIPPTVIVTPLPRKKPVPPVDPLVLKPEEPTPPQQNFDHYSTRGEAFNAAKKAGLDIFDWKGKSYTTETKEEKAAARAASQTPEAPVRPIGLQ